MKSSLPRMYASLKKSFTLLFAFLILSSTAALYAQTVTLAVRPYGSNSDEIYGFNPTTHLQTCNFAVSIATGEVVSSMNGIAVHPTTGEIYVLAKLNGFPGNQRRLLKVDPATGSAVIVGNTGEALAGIVFAGGTLYAISGDGASPAETLYTLSLVDATPTLHTTLGAGDDGEAIAYNYDDGLIYHASGLGVQNVNEFFESITIPASPGTVTNIPLSGDDYDELFALVYVGGGTFIGVDINSTFFSITTAGVVANLGIVNTAFYRGMAVAPDTNGDGCPDLAPIAAAVPTMSQWGLFLLALLLLNFGASALLSRSLTLVSDKGSATYNTSAKLLHYIPRNQWKSYMGELLATVAILFVGIFLIWGEITILDIPTALLTSPLIVNLIYLAKKK